MVLVLLVATLSLVGAVLAGGGLHRLRLRAVRLLVVAAALQLVTGLLLPGSAVARATTLVLSALLVALFLYGNRSAPGVALVAAGLLCNVAVVAANAAMPVSVTAATRAGISPEELRLAEDALHEPMTDATRLGVLADRIPVALPVRPQVVSVGDVLVASGVGLLLVGAAGSGATGSPVGRRHRPRRTDRSTVLDSASTTTGSYS